MQPIRRWIPVFAALALAPGLTCGSAPPRPQAKIIALRQIWDRASHNAYPSLLRYHNRFFLALREGSSQVSPDGAIRILTSVNGQDWRIAATLAATGDLRYPKLTVTADHELMLTAQLMMIRPPSLEYQTMRWLSKDGLRWSEKSPAADLNYVLGQPVLRGKSLFALASRRIPPFIVRMYGGLDDTLKRIYLDQIYATDRPADASLLFPSPESAVSIVRCQEGEHEWLGVSKTPFRKWQWKSINPDLSDIQMVKAGPKEIIVGGKSVRPKQQTSISRLDLKHGRLEELLILPSGGDTGSPSMVMYDGYLWVAYHSSHYRNTSIYLAKLKLP